MEYQVRLEKSWKLKPGLRQKNHKAVVLRKIRHGIAYGLHRLADHVEPSEYVRSKGLVSMSQI